MAIYRASGVFQWGTTVSLNIAIADCMFEIVGSPTDYLTVKSIGFSGSSANGGRFFGFGIGRSTAGAPPAISFPFIPDDINSPPTPAYVTCFWAGKLPTTPAKFLRRYACQPASGAQSAMRFPRGLTVYPGQTLTAFITGNINLQTNNMDFSMEIDA